jgi:hypothetical protein
MLELLSLVACGWLLMVNPTDNLKLPVAEWRQLGAFDTAVKCENDMVFHWQRSGKENREFQHERWRCVPADFIYPHAQPQK